MDNLCPICGQPMIPHYENVAPELCTGHYEVRAYVCPDCGITDDEEIEDEQ